MRHVILPKAITTRPFSMSKAAAAAGLIASAGFAQRLPARFLRTAFAAVNLPAIPMAADQHLDPAPRAKKIPRRRIVGTVCAVDAAWTRAAPGAIIPLQSCPCTL